MVVPRSVLLLVTFINTVVVTYFTSLCLYGNAYVLWTSVFPPVPCSPVGDPSCHSPEFNAIIIPSQFPTVSSGSLWLKYAHQTVRRHIWETVVVMFIALSTSDFTYFDIRYEWLGYRHCTFVAYGVWLCTLLYELQRRRKYVSSVCLSVFSACT
jgi:hypothetical protein